MTALAALPTHVVQDRVRWRRTVERRRDLTHGAKRYAAALAFHRFGPDRVAWNRRKAAEVLRCSVRSIQRWNRELVAAGVLAVAGEGGIVAGRRFLKVFRLLLPQVNQGDRLSPSRGRRLSYRRRATPGPGQTLLNIAPPDRTTASRPDLSMAVSSLSGGRPAGDGT